MNKKSFTIFLVMVMILTSSVTAFADTKTDRKDAFTNMKLDNGKKLYDKVKKDANFQFIYDDGNGNYSFTVSKNSKKSKKEMLSILEDYAANQTIVYPIQGYGSTTSVRPSGWLQSRFQTLANYSPSMFNDTLSLSGQSGSSWDGSDIAQYAAQSDIFQVTAVTAELSLSSLPSFGFSYYDKTLTFNYPTINNVYCYFHSYGGINFSGYNFRGLQQQNITSYVIGGYSVSTYCAAYVSFVSGF